MSAVLDMQDYRVTTVVEFTPQYEKQVLEIAYSMLKESTLHRNMVMNEKKLLSLLYTSRANQNVYFRIAVRQDEVIGGFLAQTFPLFFTDELVAKDLAIFVKPNRRGSYAFVLLLADWERWCDSRGIRKKLIGQATGVEVDGTRRLYEKLGYQVVGVNAVKESCHV